MRSLGRDDVHVWRLRLDVDGPRADQFLATLDADEERRRSSHRDPRCGRRWAVARGGLRWLLAAYTGDQPESVRFTRGAHGKLQLAGHGICFSLTHADDLALYAFAHGRQVGVDAERLDARRVSMRVAAAFLGAHATERLRSSGGERRTREFFQLWTRHEALLKAMGTGLSLEITPRSAAGAPGWWLRDLPVGPAHAGAIAVEGEAPSLRLFGLDVTAGDGAPHPQRQPPQAGAQHAVCDPSRLQREGQPAVPARDPLTS